MDKRETGTGPPSLEDQLWGVLQRRSKEPTKEERYKEISRERFLKILRKKSKTTFVGAVSYLEQFFGDLWGQDKPPEERSEAERRWYDRYLACRAKIFNNGNNQLRAIECELRSHDVEWNRYEYELGVMPPVDEGNEDERKD